MKLIMGLGNPGAEYKASRHNIGFLLVDLLAQRWSVDIKRQKHDAMFGQGCFQGESVMLMKPMTYMNRSGQSASAMSRFYDIAVEKILVVHDELDLPAGSVKLKKGGGHGGHNGLRDLISHFSSKDFYRLRLGIAHPGHKSQVVDYVLKKPSKEDKQLIDSAIDDALRVMPEIVSGQFERAMHQLHSRD